MEPSIGTESSLGVYQPTYRKKPKRLKKDGTPYKSRKGWGPYRSVPNERAVAFNLQLDVQTLQQEVHNMVALRDILRTKILQQNHTPEGSLLHLVKEYFQVFRAGSALPKSLTSAAMKDKYRDQRDFMFSVVDEQVDVGNGLRGAEYMQYQMDMYSTLIRWIRITMHSFNIVKAEDSVVISTNATLRFQVVRATIEKIFPHIMGNEMLVSQLVGKEAEPRIGMTFYFNAQGKCCKFDADMDFVGAFTSIVKDPKIVETLFRRALIADNCQLGMIDEPPELEVDEEMEEKPLATVTLSKTLDATCDSLEGSARDPRSGSRVRPVEADLMPVSTPAPALRSALKPLVRDVQIACLQAVKDYYIAFADGYPVDGAKEAVALQRDFFINRLDPKALTENQASPKYVVERWRSLSECFTVLGFHQKSVASVEYHHHVGTCAVSSSARYALRITPTTISSVFPHVAAYPHLYQGLVGEVLIVASQIYFAIEADTGRICRIEERMDFEAGVARIVGSAQELDFVLSQANLVLDGVSCRKKMELSAPT